MKQDKQAPDQEKIVNPGRENIWKEILWTWIHNPWNPLPLNKIDTYLRNKKLF